MSDYCPICNTPNHMHTPYCPASPDNAEQSQSNDKALRPPRRTPRSPATASNSLPSQLRKEPNEQ